MCQRAVAAEEFSTVTSHIADRLARLEKSHAAGEFGVVRIARQQRAAFEVDFSDHMHHRFRPQIAKHPLGVSGNGEPARPA